jgi:creatinine amidohydrolase
MKKLAELTWKEAEAAKSALVLLPIGSTEAHGPHLPLATDVILSEELARRAGAALEGDGWSVLIAPPVNYAITEYAGEFAGTISLAPETATALVADICTSLHAQGFRRICIINSHLEPAHVESLRAAIARCAGPVAFPDQLERRWARTLSDEYKRGACHAGQYETSLVMAARPELVRERSALEPKPIDLAAAMKRGVKTFREAGAEQAYFGDPAAATAAHGDEQYARLVEMVVATVRETFGERP